MSAAPGPHIRVQWFRLSLLGVADTADAARALRDELSGYLSMGRSMLGMMQLPANLLDSVAIDSRGTQVTLDADLSFADLDHLRAAAKATGTTITAVQPVAQYGASTGLPNTTFRPVAMLSLLHRSTVPEITT